MLFASCDSEESGPSTSPIQWAQSCRHFEFPEILLATDDFDESLVIGRGGFGKVYRGTILNGSTPVVAAIKRLDSNSNQGAPEFWAEVEVLSKLRHCHLVSLFGYCNYEKEMILIYEYMPHGTLEDHLHKLSTPLSWLQRLNICIGAGRGLDYLHTGTGIEVGVIHRDVKSSNILLHESWAAKISDFGLSRLGPRNQPSTYVNTLVKGTIGYLDPDYFSTGRLTRKSDVYAFGVLLFEMLCRKRAVDRSLDEEQCSLARWVQDSIKNGTFKHKIDSEIRGQISPKCLQEFVRIAEKCLHSRPKQRPTMSEVVASLDSILTLQEKVDSSLQLAGKTSLGRMFEMFLFSSKGKNSAHNDLKPSSSSKGNTGSVGNTVGSGISNPCLKEFKFDELKRATRNFSNKFNLGKGGFGEMSVGWVDKATFTSSIEGVGFAVAVERYSEENPQEDVEWQATVNLLRGLAHPNIISLLGYCNDKKRGRLLVYEYMQNRNLGHFLFGDAPEPLKWETRLLIMIGIARGLTYLHSCNDQVIHRDVNSSNILLDKDFNAKLGNFGLARSGPEFGRTYVSTCVVGTFGYIDPHYEFTCHLSVKSDIYSFGVVLLETLTGLRAYELVEQNSLVNWAKRRKVKEIMDPRLEQNYPQEGAFECAALALRCLKEKPEDRPPSEEVLQRLDQIYAVNK